MPTEQLILRRVFPVPVTFADLRRAYYILAFTLPSKASEHWHAAIKEATGALDEVYAVIDGREVRVAIVKSSCRTTEQDSYDFTGQISWEPSSYGIRWQAISDLLIKADEAGYWQRPHEVRHVLEESQMSHKTMARIAANSFIAAGVK